MKTIRPMTEEEKQRSKEKEAANKSLDQKDERGNLAPQGN
jgi:hypothetical protein